MMLLDRRQLPAAAAVAFASALSNFATGQQPDPIEKKLDTLTKRLESGIDHEKFYPAFDKGKVAEVTSLDVKSFVDACKDNRVVTFKVGGVIDLKGKEIIIKNSNLSILGCTAPEPITFINGTVRFEGKDVLVDSLRFIGGNDAGKYPAGKEPSSVKVSGVGTANICFYNCDFAAGVHANVHIDWSVEKGNKGAPSRIKFVQCAFSHGIKKGGHNKTAGLFKDGHSCGIMVDDYVTGVEFDGCFFNALQFGIVWGANSSGLVKNCVMQNIPLVPIFMWPVPGEYKDDPTQCKSPEVAVIGCVAALDPKKGLPASLAIGYVDPKLAPGLPRVSSKVFFYENGVTSGMLPNWSGLIVGEKIGTKTKKAADALAFVKMTHLHAGAFPNARGDLFDGIFAAAARSFEKAAPLKKGDLDLSVIPDSPKDFGGYPKTVGAAERSIEIPDGEGARIKVVQGLRAGLAPVVPPKKK